MQMKRHYISNPLFLLFASFTLNGCSEGFQSLDENGQLRESLGSIHLQARTGKVEASGRALKDDSGEFFALGATLFYAPWAYKFDRQKLERELALLQRNGFDYIRVLGNVGGGQFASYWTGLEVDVRWPDYDQVIAGLTDLAYDKYGLRVQWTIFGSGDALNASERRNVVDRMLQMARGREHKIIHFEIANESWQTGFPGGAGLQELRELSLHMKNSTDVLVAASAPEGHECEERLRVYQGGIADIGTIHFDRDISRVDGYWRPVRQPWEYIYCEGMPAIGSNNEPIGPGASVSSDSNPYHLVAGALNTYLSNLPLYVYHDDAGIRGRVGWASAVEAFRAMKNYVPKDITNWNRHNHHWPGHPFIVYADNTANLVWPDGASDGVVRAYAATSGNRFFVNPIGIKNFVRMEAKENMRFDALDPVTGEIKAQVCLRRGESVTLSGLSTYVLKGEFTSNCNSQGSVAVGGVPVASGGGSREPASGTGPQPSGMCGDEGSYTGRGYLTEEYCRHTYNWQISCVFSDGCWRPVLTGNANSCGDQGSYTGLGYTSQQYCEHTYDYNLRCSLVNGCWRPQFAQ